jgi:Cu-Zn family superoxide dismutase
MTKLFATILAAGFGLGLAAAADAATKTVTVNAIDATGVKAAIGSIKFRDSRQGLVVEPELKGLPAGLHGFHIHENANCGTGTQNNQTVAGLAAGGHYDPAGTKKHEGPHGAGHLGDMPALWVDSDGSATLPVLAKRLKTKDISGRSVIIHAGGDNYADAPAALGGGGARIACGLIK